MANNTFESVEVYALHLSIDSGLAYHHSICPPTDIDLDSYSHVIFTSPQKSDPTVLVYDITPELLKTLTCLWMILFLMIH